VLGSDDGGEAALTYTWSVVSSPSSATPVFSINGSNAAKRTTVTFNRAGNYTFQVTITDAGGLSVTSRVGLTVYQTLTSIVVSPSSVTLIDGKTQQFTATGLDQFGLSLAGALSYRWSIVQGSGRLSSRGLYTAPAKGRGTAIVQAKSGIVSGIATITFHPRLAAARLRTGAKHPKR
jgi:hypothetical protein